MAAAPKAAQGWGSVVLFGIILIVLGAIYLWKPTIFRRGIWMKTSIAIRLFSEENYTIYMRVLGVILVMAGLFFVIRSA
jgi:uncharacterized membrane protein HdeD (DUF308 family)